MIGTIRKHSIALWWVVGGLTVISFVWWGANVPTRGGGGGMRTGNYGSIYGKKITMQEYANALHEFYLFHWFHNREWPTKMQARDMDQEIYIRLMLFRKAEQLGIQVSEEAAATAALDMLRSVSGNGQNVSLQVFAKQILAPEGLTTEDFERFARHDLVIQQLIQTMGLPGALVTPQEAAADWQHEHQDRTAQILFFTATNYLPQVAVTPAAIAQFYSNHMADYREPDRVQINYVEFSLSNYLAQAETELAKSNLDSIVDANYQRFGQDYFPDAKTPEAAKARFREELIRQRAAMDAHVVANDFATAVVDLTNTTPTRAASLATVAKQQGLTVRATAPFARQYGPEEFLAPQTFTKAAFALTPDDPFAGPVAGSTSFYEIALVRQLPTEIPPLASISDRVTQDYKMDQAIALAQRAGTNFVSKLNVELAAGRGFAAACVASGFHPELLTPFSLSAAETPPEAAGRATLPELKQAVFATQVGHASGFVQTAGGGFIAYVEKELPPDEVAMKTDLPQYIAALRRTRENEVFNEWLAFEAQRELRGIPALQKDLAGAGR
jgi:hypothetical protein